ncbi:hypothetical protein ACJRO7_017024 [Eucalyptus globulus]|uniref:Glutaredoxin domain-containing protein n=1 Tax=Eucalyptus globulus TaxID=34317 RepID=A0ABD3KT64_EUCGL
MQPMPKEAAGIPADDGLTPSKPMSSYEEVRRLAASNAVVLFSMNCMCTVAKTLLFSLRVGHDIHSVLHQLAPGAGTTPPCDRQALPAVFVGGKFLGGLKTLMACHINGSLVPLLKNASALWL